MALKRKETRELNNTNLIRLEALHGNSPLNNRILDYSVPSASMGLNFVNSVRNSLRFTFKIHRSTRPPPAQDGQEGQDGLWSAWAEVTNDAHLESLQLSDNYCGFFLESCDFTNGVELVKNSTISPKIRPLLESYILAHSHSDVARYFRMTPRDAVNFSSFEDEFKSGDASFTDFKKNLFSAGNSRFTVFYRPFFHTIPFLASFSDENVPRETVIPISNSGQGQLVRVYLHNMKAGEQGTFLSSSDANVRYWLQLVDVDLFVKAVNLSSSFSVALAKKMRASSGIIPFPGLCLRSSIYNLPLNGNNLDCTFTNVHMPSHIVFIPVKKCLVTVSNLRYNSTPWRISDIPKLNIASMDYFFKERNFRSTRSVMSYDYDKESAQEIRHSFMENAPFFGWQPKPGIVDSIYKNKYVYPAVEIIPFGIWDETGYRQGGSTLAFPAESRNLPNDFYKTAGELRVKVNFQTPPQVDQLMIIVCLAYNDDVPFATFNVSDKTIESRHSLWRR